VVSKVALTLGPKATKDNKPSSSRVVAATTIARFLEQLRPIAEFEGIGDVSIDLTQEKTSLVITSPDHGADVLEGFLESLRPVSEYAALGDVHVEVLQDEQEDRNKLYIVVIEFQGLIEIVLPFRDKKLAEAYFEEKTHVPWEVYNQRERGPATMYMLGNYSGSYINQFDDFV
jgi:hypothetical protein